jgi:Nucleotide modification associated domain 2
LKVRRTFIYVVDRDFGFAPNPFHGMCTLATCKHPLRASAEKGDWVFGVGGRRLGAKGRCIFAMRVDQKIPFEDYWEGREFRLKRPVRNGTQKMLAGDNIYKPSANGWIQADSHHSNLDGSQHADNTARDTKTDAVLISRHFFYFGKSAPEIPLHLLNVLGYKNQIGHRVFEAPADEALIDWIQSNFEQNMIVDDPFDFESADARYDYGTDHISR